MHLVWILIMNYGVAKKNDPNYCNEHLPDTVRLAALSNKQQIRAPRLSINLGFSFRAPYSNEEFLEKINPMVIGRKQRI